MPAFNFYGLLVGLGILTGFWAAEKARQRLAVSFKQYAQLTAWQLFWWSVIPALLGARLYHVVDFWEYYSQFPAKILATWEGGMGIWGGILGGMVGLLAFSAVVTGRQLISKMPNAKLQTLNKIPNYQLLISNYLAMADVAAFGLPIGQAIGRLGNYFNQELYGLPTDLPWGLYIRPERRLVGFGSFERFQPLFAYEAMWDLIIFITVITIIKVILKKDRKAFHPGFLFFTYLGLYGLGRFFLEFWRIDPWKLGWLTTAQWFSLMAMMSFLLFHARISKLKIF